ncbi:MAG: hypothetical protein LW854_23370, partial [Rubrivivax sp.]|nr:hypothetical protein [Rubrivivax sp.]
MAAFPGVECVVQKPETRPLMHGRAQRIFLRIPLHKHLGLTRVFITKTVQSVFSSAFAAQLSRRLDPVQTTGMPVTLHH